VKKLTLILLFLNIVLNSECSAQFYYRTITYVTNDNPEFLFTCDINDDTFDDILIVNYGVLVGNIQILINQNAEGFILDSTYSGVGNSPRSAAHGDFDNDGDEDICIANYNHASITFMQNLGNGKFSVLTNLIPVGEGPLAIVVEDYNSDNRVDIAVANSLANIVGPIEVTYRYFDHSGEGPFVSDSYINTSPNPGEIPFTFDEIPVYNRAGRGDQIRLNDVIDFRPTFDGTTFSRVFLPSSGSAFNISYSYYLPRIDKLVLTRNKEFKIIKGVPSLTPRLPETIVDAMELYRFYVPAYTYDPKNVETKFIENKRFTMRDIGKLERRINQLEYYSTLSLLELSTESLFIADADGNNRFKNGIIVDQFTGHGVGNVTNPDYNCSIDFRNLELRPPFTPRLVEFDVKTTNSLIQTSDDLIILPYTTENLITQPLATTSININPFSVVNWLGGVVLDPSSDFWIDTTRAADVLVNLEGDNDAWEELGSVAFETEWGEWSTRVLGTEREGNVNVTTSETSREGVELRIVPERIERNIGDRVVDVSIIPFMRSITLNVTATGLRPNTRLYAFFDGTNVSDDCTFLDGGTRKTLTAAALISDSSGAIGSDKAVQFVVPAGQFRTGERLFRLTDEADNIVANAKTSAEVVFPAQGLLQTRQDVSISTRIPTLLRNNVTESVITEERNPIDPLAQTFFINAAEYPNGVQVDSVTVFFKKKSSALPVTLQLRTVVNGYPSSLVYPFANVTKRPEDVNISEVPDVADTGTGTTFKFSSPVHLLPGQHSIVLLSNSDDYEAYISVMGETQIGTDIPVTEQPNLGSLFKSQNASTWTADQNADLMFKINKCKFNTSGVNQFSLIENWEPAVDHYEPRSKILDDSRRLVGVATVEPVLPFPRSRHRA